MRFAFVLAMLVVAPVLAGCAEDAPAPATTSPGPTPPAATATPSPTAPASNGKECVSTRGSERAATPTWVLETSMGTIRIKLFCDKTPLTAQHFVNLTETAYFDGTKFHRVIRDFMDQGGDPCTKLPETPSCRWGTGGPTDASGKRVGIVDEFYCADGTVSYSHPASCKAGLGLKHDKPGVLSMANTGQPRTGGSQFFLTAVPTPHLDGKHAIFGEVADRESLDVVLAINRAPTGPGDRPDPPIVLERATIDWG